MRAVRFSARHARIAARYFGRDAYDAAVGRFGARVPQRRQR
jgi:hypothetical protein